MANFSALNKKVAKLISTKPILLTPTELEEVGDQINLVGVDATKSISESEIKSFAPRLLNWVEPYTIAGIRKTLFYTEVNSGLKVGDRVFIINGNYDSDLLIKIDKYKKGRDGYKILYVNECQIVLDIDYTGELVWNDDDQDKFINVHHIKTNEDFLHANRYFTTRGGDFRNKFDYYQNNIIFVEQDFNSISEWGKTPGLSGSPGFFVRDDYDASSNGVYSWTNITNEIMSGSYSLSLSPTYQTNGRLKILNGSFTVSVPSMLNPIYDEVFEFKEGFVYKWDIGEENDAVPGTASEWVIDVRYHQPIITKGNFRDGNFKGEFNTGLYGRQNKKIDWEGTGEWNNGTLLNTNWIKGELNSKFTQAKDYLSEFDINGIPYQKINGFNNNGKGYNYIIDSNFENSTIENGNFIKSKFGEESFTFSSVENHILSTPFLFKNKISNGFFNECYFYNSNVNGGEISSCRSENTKFINIKSVNSNYKNSVIKDSSYLSDDIIKIKKYDEFIISEYKSGAIGATNSGRPISHKVYKFYISKDNFNKLKLKDSFYIKGIKINDNSKNAIKFFDKKFRVGSWTEYIEDFSDPSGDTSLTNSIITTPITYPFSIDSYAFYKRGFECTVLLSTPADNEWRYTATTGGYTSVVDFNSGGYSIDIIVSTYDISSPNSGISGIDFNREQSISPGTPSIPNSIGNGNNIDFSKAYIIDSDFESGLFETSTWNSGRHINRNYDVNITIPSLDGGYYDLDISTASSTITAVTTNNLIYPELREDELLVGDIVYLNNIDYDTTGKVTSLILVTGASGSGYSLSATDTPTINGNGTDLTVDYTADTIGTILSINNLYGGGNYGDGNYFGQYVLGGSGSGAQIDYTVGSNSVISVTISNGGVGYNIGDTLEIIGGNPTASFDVLTITNGEVLSVTINNSGIGYNIGDIVTINDGDINAQVEILATTGSVVTLPDTYKIQSKLQGATTSSIVLEEVLTGTYSVLSTLLTGGVCYTGGAYNRYGYIHKTKFNRSEIKSGLFRRSYFKESFIENNEYDVTDRDFNNIEKIRNLIISDSIFRNTNNILSDALYINSSFVYNNDKWNNGLGQFLIWNGMTFNNGTIKQSRWIDGIFNDGLFYNSKTFNAIPTVNHQYYYNDNIKSYYKDGPTTATTSNNRHSFQDGIFNNGEFYKSDWETGTFNNGIFYYSKWYSGLFNNGQIGKETIDITNTLFYNGTINYATVENATLYSIDTSWLQQTNNNIYWKNGIFNSGLFGSDLTQTAVHTATWSKGIFNGGQFVTNAKWLDGIFNGGKFLSGYGWTLSDSILPSDYTWEDGVFNGGEFGNAETGTNSTWYTGEFNGGEFKGRVWNNGVFLFGEFKGSAATFSSIGGLTSSNASDFVDSFNTDYYGLWRSGIVSDTKDKFIKTKKLFTPIKRAINQKRETRKAILSNALWINGTFSHPSGEMNNCVWLNGKFERGEFKYSSFNPYVKRDGSPTQSFNLTDTCYWENGKFEGGDFYISTWEDGVFELGNGYGMIWKNGINNYMNAFNICWEDGLWRNGNWYGSSFKLSGSGEVIDDYTRQILFNVMNNCTGTSSCHVWNIFIEEPIDDTTEITNQDAGPIGLEGYTKEKEKKDSGPSLPKFEFPSDRRLKSNIKLIGKTTMGINIYQFNFNKESYEYHNYDTNILYQGVIAQELIGTEFENCLSIDKNGYYIVDYSMIDIEFKEV